jgi:hypothetical protein
MRSIIAGIVAADAAKQWQQMTDFSFLSITYCTE